MANDLFEQHLRLIEGGAPTSGPDVAEWERAESFRPMRPLTLRGHGHNRQRFFVAVGGALALAATAALFVMQRHPVDPTSDLALKGGAGATRVWLIWERGGEPLEWNDTAQAEDGDLVSAEVTAGAQVVAFMGIYDDADLLLSTPERMQTMRMDLEAGERRRFEGGFALVGADENEQLVVFVCKPGTVSAGSLPDIASTDGDGCNVTRYPLR